MVQTDVWEPLSSSKCIEERKNAGHSVVQPMEELLEETRRAQYLQEHDDMDTSNYRNLLGT